MKRFVLILGWSIAGALLLGAVGLIVGFFGPLLVGVLVDSQANLGPLWGIFVLGPVGVLLGAVTGLFLGLKKARNKPE
ncbi:MAG: hypothetical protein DWQ28_03215 [Proteobacteria bacterium]|nr:MAG: hypothetical protein DWQ28_03215 [Pseudomonadota bacterium]